MSSTTVTRGTDTDSYLACFNRLEKDLGPIGKPSVQRLRRSAIARFGEVGLPTSRTEDWRFTPLAPLVQTAFEPAAAGPFSWDTSTLRDVAGLDAACRLVFVNGSFSRDLSSVLDLPGGVTVGSLARAMESAPEGVEAHLGRHARFEENPFTALNTAFFRDGAFINLPRNAHFDKPIYLVYLAAPGGTAPLLCYPRNLIVAGSGSRATLVEVYSGPTENVSFTNTVTEIVIEDGAAIDHYKLQQEGTAAFHFANTQVRLGRSTNFASHFVGLGGRWVRNEVRALLDAEGCECTLNGLYRAASRQHMDNFTVIDHARPHCASHELYKGILDGTAHGVFNGKIFVRQDAQKTDAKQTNKTLLLSDDATINTKPQLEIYADDVKCTHGATVGQLDPDALFYLRARGIGLAQARDLLTFAFANDILSRIKVEDLRGRLERSFLRGGAPIEEMP
jgi:Fe-S cluster assembly protein SufD